MSWIKLGIEIFCYRGLPMSSSGLRSDWIFPIYFFLDIFSGTHAY